MAMTKAQFERIFTSMAREFGTIRKGDEDAHMEQLYPLEANVLRVHRSDPLCNSRRLREAIALVLYDLRDRLSGQVTDVGRFRNDGTAPLEKALLMGFDPFTNEKITGRRGPLNKRKLDAMSSEELKDYYTEPVKCLLRIKDSVDVWEKRYGSDGYFIYLEQSFGRMVRGTDMEFTFPV